VVAKIKAPVHPDAVVRNVDLVLGADGPLASGGYPFALWLSATIRGASDARGAGWRYLCALPSNHGFGEGGGLSWTLWGAEAPSGRW
jgi:hypothetical protein